MKYNVDLQTKMGKDQLGFGRENLSGKAVRWTREREKGIQELQQKNKTESRERLLDKQGGVGIQMLKTGACKKNKGTFWIKTIDRQTGWT